MVPNIRKESKNGQVYCSAYVLYHLKNNNIESKSWLYSKKASNFHNLALGIIFHSENLSWVVSVQTTRLTCGAKTETRMLNQLVSNVQKSKTKKKVSQTSIFMPLLYFLLKKRGADDSHIEPRKEKTSDGWTVDNRTHASQSRSRRLIGVVSRARAKTFT